MATKDVFSSSLNAVPNRDRWAWRLYGRTIYECIKNRYTKNDIFTRVALRNAECLASLAPSARRAAISVTFKYLVASGHLAQISKTRFALSGNKVMALEPQFIEGKDGDIWLNHGHTFSQAVRCLPKNKALDRSAILRTIDWLPDKSIGTRYVYFSMIEPELVGRGILKTVDGSLYKR